MAQQQPKQYHNLPFYFGIVAATTLIVGLPAVAAVRTSTTAPTVARTTTVSQTVKDRLAAKVDEFQTQTFADRQAAVVKLLDKINQALIKAEAALPTTQLSDATKAEVQTTLDNAQAQVASLQTQVTVATTVDELVAIRQAALKVLYDNKDTLKSVGVDIYVDSLQVMVDADQAALSSSNTVSVYLSKEFVKNKVDVTKLAEALTVANVSLKLAQDSLVNLDSTSVEQVSAATINVLMATQATMTVNQELDKAVNQLPK